MRLSDPPSAIALALRVVVAPDCLPIADPLLLATASGGSYCFRVFGCLCVSFSV